MNKQLFYLTLFGFFITTNLLSQDITDGLVGYWPFNGNANDESGNNNHGTVNGATLITDRFGNEESAFEFTGDANDNIAIPDLGITSDTHFTISTWVKPGLLPDYMAILGYDRTHRLLVQSDGKMLTQFDGNHFSETGAVVSEKWNHVVYCFDGAKAYWFINGLQSGGMRETDKPDWSAPFFIGSYGEVHYPFVGSIDEVRVYNRVLDETEIEELYSGESITQTNGWQLDGDKIYTNDAKVGIGTTDPKNKLSVNGTIWAKEVKVTMTDAADWVFEDDYDLKSLEEVEDFINQNKHLPDIPSADEFRENDMNVAEMNNKLLQKIEELTLYLIEQNKKVEEQSKKIEDQQKAIEILMSKVQIKN